MFAFGAVNVSEGVDVGAVLEASLMECGISQKHAAIVCRVNEMKFSRALKGAGPLDLWWLRHLMVERDFPKVFLSKLASALIRRFFDDLQVPYRMARADIRQQETKKERVS